MDAQKRREELQEEPQEEPRPDGPPPRHSGPLPRGDSFGEATEKAFVRAKRIMAVACAEFTHCRRFFRALSADVAVLKADETKSFH